MWFYVTLFGPSRGVLGPACGVSNASWKRLRPCAHRSLFSRSGSVDLGTVQGQSRSVFRCFVLPELKLGPVLCDFVWAVSGRLGGDSGPSCAVLGTSWGPLGASWSHLEASWGMSRWGPSWSLLSRLGSLLGGVLGLSWDLLERSWGGPAGLLAPKHEKGRLP